MKLLTAYRLLVAGLLTFAMSQRVALAAPAQDIVGDLGKQVLGVVFSFGGLAGAIGAAVVGVKLIVGSASGSSYATSQAVLALMGVVGGIALMIAGPAISDAVLDALASVPKTITIPTP